MAGKLRALSALNPAWVLLATITFSLVLNPSDAFLATRPIPTLPSFHKGLILRSTGADIEEPLPRWMEADESASLSAENPASLYRAKVNEIDFCIAPADVSLSRAYRNAQNPKSTVSTPVSLTRALNNASNRAVRRILLSKSWPSAEALNLSLRRAMEASVQAASAEAVDDTVHNEEKDDESPKCPVPRRILDILVNRRDTQTPSFSEGVDPPLTRKSRTDEQYVADQLRNFRERYGTLAGYAAAEAYLESILSLATSGEESRRVSEVISSGVYDESYRRVLAAIRSVGAVFQEIEGTDRKCIAPKLVDQDICLSMMDKINMKRKRPVAGQETLVVEPAEIPQVVRNVQPPKKEGKDEEISGDELGGVLLSAKEPTMTRQLNALSNIVQRALLFGGDQELLVLSETLDADKPAFVERWYPGSGVVSVEANLEEETRPGVQYFNCLVQLLKECYRNGVVTSLDPPVPLIQSYMNAYERLMATLVEFGSGYIKPTAANADVMTMPKPRTATEELGRFAVWESKFRQASKSSEVTSYPEDLEGLWEVRDEIGGEIIGVSTVEFQPQGQVKVEPPMKGLRWRLDPGPTHLDTCTFQVLGEDGTILQYRGFIDRGARLEARFSKRPSTIRGSVMFQMRDGDVAVMGEDYWKDMLPINYRTGTTKFVMTKQMEKNQ